MGGALAQDFWRQDMKHSYVVQLFSLGVAGYASLAMAQTPGTFAATGNMTSPRSWHTATLLTNGKVLITGGSLGFNPLATAELYDPDRGTFTSTGRMTTPRMAHSATLLPDGKVLIAGGTIEAGQGLTPSHSAEIYDPSTGTFAPTGNLIGGHVCQQAALLGSGKVLIAGGSGPPDPVPDAELYDPATGTFSAAGKYVTDTSGFNTCEGSELTLLADGRVLIVWEAVRAELYDPHDDAFTRTNPPLAIGYSDGLPTATLLMNGKVLVAGGAWDGDLSPTGAALYDSGTETFAATGDMVTGHVLGTATQLPDGSVLMAGSFTFGTFPVSRANAEIYGPVTGTFTATGNMMARSLHTATLLNNGKVLIAGGNAGVNLSLSQAELYTPSVLAPAPVLLSLSGNAAGQGAILHAGTARVVTESDPAFAGEVLEIYGTGLNTSGVIVPQIAIGSQLAEVLYFGDAPGFPGLNQMDVRVPTGIGPGAAVPVRLNYLNRPSNAVTIGIR
jgi:Galactose oxidase, central domain